MSRMCCLPGQKIFSLSSTLFCLINAQHATTKMFERCFKQDIYCGGNQLSYLSLSRKPYITIHFYVDYCLHNNYITAQNTVLNPALWYLMLLLHFWCVVNCIHLLCCILC